MLDEVLGAVDVFELRPRIGLSSAQLAARYPTSGGTYVYGRERLGPWAGFVAGWGFVVGKTASCAAMALTVGAYLAPAGGNAWSRSPRSSPSSRSATGG